MSANLKAIDLFEIEYINLSEQLREELESKIENLYTHDHFVKYTGSENLNFPNAAKANFLCAYLIGRSPRNYVLSGNYYKVLKPGSICIMGTDYQLSTNSGHAIKKSPGTLNPVKNRYSVSYSASF